MDTNTKSDIILDALQELLKTQDLQNISVNDIAQKAGVGKGSIYYYFNSKDAIVDALIERNYKIPLETAKELAKQKEISPYHRMALIFSACRNSSQMFSQSEGTLQKNGMFQTAQSQAYIHQKYLKYLINELKPYLTEIIQQEIDEGLIVFEYPEELAEIVLIVLTVKLDNHIIPSTSQEIENCIRALITLLEKGTGTQEGALNYLTDFETTTKNNNNSNIS